ncbi:MAG TPA: EI24 domain-containing protein [Polyangia bacterium]
MQIVRGFVAPFRGALFVARHGLWGYLIAPLLLNLALVAAGGWVGGRYAARWFDLGEGGAGDLAARILVWVVVALVALLVFLVLQPVVAGPFVDLLTEKCERLERGHAPSPGLLRSAAEAAAHGLLKSCLYGVALVFTLLAGALTGVGAALGAILYAVFIGFDGFDYPLARRNVSFSGKWRYLLSRPAQTVGYCCGAVLFYLVPLAAVVAPAFAAVGATLLYLDSAPPAHGAATASTKAPAAPPSDIPGRTQPPR